MVLTVNDNQCKAKTARRTWANPEATSALSRPEQGLRVEPKAADPRSKPLGDEENYRTARRHLNLVRLPVEGQKRPLVLEHTASRILQEADPDRKMACCLEKRTKPNKPRTLERAK